MRKQVIVGLAFAMYVAGCAAASDPGTGVSTHAPAVAAPPDWQRSWLRNEPCAVPCFLGITPGTSTPTETLALVHSAYPGIEPEELHATSSDPSSIIWRWDAQDPVAGVAAYFYEAPPQLFAAPANTILSVTAGAPAVLPVREVMAVYGDPSHVLAVAESFPRTMFYSLSFVYLDRGVMVSMPLAQAQPPTLSPDLMVQELVFFPPSRAGFDAGVSAFRSMREPSLLLVPWQGFGSFFEYCRESKPDPVTKGCR